MREQVHDITLVGDGGGGLVFNGCLGPGKDLIQVGGDLLHPSLVKAGLNTRGVHFGNQGDRPGNSGGLGLGAAHTAQAGTDEKQPCQVAVGGHAAHFAAGIEQGVVGTVNDSLGADVHPTAGSHLPIR